MSVALLALVISASRILDGRGHVIRNAAVVVDGSKIVRIDPHPSRADIDLGRTEVQLLGVRGATGGYEQCVTFHHLLDVATRTTSLLVVPLCSALTNVAPVTMSMPWLCRMLPMLSAISGS